MTNQEEENSVPIYADQMLSFICSGNPSNNRSGMSFNRINQCRNNKCTTTTANVSKFRSILDLIYAALILLAWQPFSGIDGQLIMHGGAESAVSNRYDTNHNLVNAMNTTPFHADEHSLHLLPTEWIPSDGHTIPVAVSTHRTKRLNNSVVNSGTIDNNSSKLHSNVSGARKTSSLSPRLARLSEMNSTNKKRRRPQLMELMESRNDGNSISLYRSHRNIRDKSNLDRHISAVDRDYRQSTHSPMFAPRQRQLPPFSNSFDGPSPIHRRILRPNGPFSAYRHQNEQHLPDDMELPNRLVFEPSSRNWSPSMSIANDQRQRSNFNDRVEQTVANRFLRDRQNADDNEAGLDRSWRRGKRNQLFSEGLYDRPHHRRYPDSDRGRPFERGDTFQNRGYRYNQNFDDSQPRPRIDNLFGAYRKWPNNDREEQQREINWRDSELFEGNNDNADNLNNANSNPSDSSARNSMVVGNVENNDNRNSNRNHNNRHRNRHHSYANNLRKNEQTSAQDTEIKNYANEQTINKLNANTPNNAKLEHTSDKLAVAEKDAAPIANSSSVGIGSLSQESYGKNNDNPNNLKPKSANKNSNEDISGNDRNEAMKGDHSVQRATGSIVPKTMPNTQADQDGDKTNSLPSIAKPTVRLSEREDEDENGEAQNVMQNLIGDVEQIMPQSNQYSKTLPPVSSEKQLVTVSKELIDESGPSTSDSYSKRDRGFGFIKAWAWDRGENYRTVTEKKKPEKYTSNTSTSIGQN